MCNNKNKQSGGQGGGEHVVLSKILFLSYQAL